MSHVRQACFCRGLSLEATWYDPQSSIPQLPGSLFSAVFPHNASLFSNVSRLFSMAETKEQRSSVKFDLLLRKTAIETVVMLRSAYGNTVSWAKRNSMSDLHAFGMIDWRPTTFWRFFIHPNDWKHPESVLENRHRTSDKLNDHMLSWSCCRGILREALRMKRTGAKFVPGSLTEKQNQSRLNTFCELNQKLQGGIEFLSNAMLQRYW